MESVDKQIKEFFENRINENIDLPFPGNMDLFFWGNQKNINLYLYKIITLSALGVRNQDGSFTYNKIIVVHHDLEINETKFEEWFKQFEGLISLQFITIFTLETSEIEVILSHNEQAFIIVFQAEKYISTIRDSRLDEVLKDYLLRNFELTYLAIAENVLYLEDKIQNNFLLLDTQLSLAEFDFFKPLYDIQKLSLCGLKMPLIEQQAKLNNEIAKLIEQKKISEALKYVDELDDIYNKEFIKLQLYADLSKDDVVGLYKHQIETLFEKLDVADLTVEEYLKIAEISKSHFSTTSTINFLEKALSLSQEYSHLCKIYDLSENFNEPLNRAVSNKILQNYPNSRKAKLCHLRELISKEDFKQAYNFASAENYDCELVKYLKFLDDYYDSHIGASYSLFRLAIDKNIQRKYLVYLFRMLIKYLKDEKNYEEWFILLNNSRNLLDKELIYSEFLKFSEQILKHADDLEKENPIFNCLLYSLEFLLDIENAGNLPLTEIQSKLADLIEFSQNNGYGYIYILLFLYDKFSKSTYELLDSTNITVDINGEDLDALKNQTYSIINELFSESTIILNGEYHSFKINLPETATIDKIIFASSNGFIEELKTNSLSKEELISSFQTQLYLIFNLSKFSSRKNTDLDFTRDSILGLYKLEMLTTQEVRDYAQNLLIFPKSDERKRVGLLHYADVFHRISNNNDSLAALALSLKVEKIAVNYYYLTAILLVRVFRDNGLLDKALEILDIMESKVKNYDKKLFDLSFSEIEFSRLSIRFKQLLSNLDNIENLKELLDDTISFNHKEMQKKSDPYPSLIQAIQINSLLKIHDNSFNKYDSFFQGMNIENIGFMSIVSSLLHNDFNSIFSLYKRLKGSYAEDLGSDSNFLRVCAESFLNDIEGKNPSEILFCLELLTEQAISNSDTFKIDAQFEKFDAPEDFENAIDKILKDCDIVYLGLNQLKKLIIAKISNHCNKSIDVRIEENFRFENYKAWSKHFPKEYGFFDVNENPNLFFDSMKTLGISIELTRETIFILDTEIHSLVPNIFLFNENLIGADEYPISISPSISWLNGIINKQSQQVEMKAWISDNDIEAYTLHTITQIYKDNKLLEKYDISLDTSHSLPKHLTHSKMVMITAHGGTSDRNSNFSSVSDEGSINLHYKDFAEQVCNNDLVVLFVCNAGRFDNHPYKATTMSLQRELLKKGCDAIIASPWPLDALMTTKWFQLFLEKWIDEALTVSQAVHRTNNELLNQDFDPSKYLALNVYGNPFKKYN